MTVLVLGASSQIGHFLLPRLHQAGYGVLALSRRAQSAQAGVRWIVGGLPGPMPVELPPLAGIVSYGPLLPFAQWLAQAPLLGTPRVVATSSMSAQTKRDSVVPAERAIAQLLRDGEQALADACSTRGLAWTVLRPTIVYGAGLDRSLTPIARRAMRLRMFPLPAGRGLRQPVHADDIAQASLAALDPAAASGEVLPIGGGERLTAGQMFARVRTSLPVATVPLPVPRSALRLAARLAPKLRGPLARLDEDLVADNTALVRLLGVQPRPFRPDPGSWGLAR
ncbi:MAG TPA: NAD-dependent epimerase/dehydratase family protein [Dyella sp.]|nr:NAD-dependent epimerase/dehydratase family protein [Dyella sp.]